jgi:CRP-like cAMP-binding protein
MASIESYVERFGLERLLSPDLRDALHLMQFEPGQFIIREGDPVENLVFLVEGKAKVFKLMENGTSLLIRFFHPLEILGDVELFAYDRWLNDVQALTETVCLGLSMESVKRAIDRNGPFLRYLCGSLARKLAGFNATSAINLRYPVENRLASYLLALGERGRDEGRLAAEYGTEDMGELADIIGASYRQLSRVIAKLKAEGILEEGRGRVRVVSRERLARLARGVYL